ncbi:MAG: type II secretion system protein [Parcubacteria group bacterium]
MYFAKKKKKKRGFTLIELLVVIAIIGILATIVVVNVNAARNKANDVAVKGTLDQVRAVAELLYNDAPSSYAALCAAGVLNTAHATYGTQLASIHASIIANNGTVNEVCSSIAGSYCVSAALKTAGVQCVDSDGRVNAVVCNTGGTSKCQ